MTAEVATERQQKEIWYLHSNRLRVIVRAESQENVAPLRDAFSRTEVDWRLDGPAPRAVVALDRFPSTVCVVWESSPVLLLDEIHEFRRINPTIPILAVVEGPTRYGFIDLIEAGAVGCLTVDRLRDSQRLVELLGAAANGEAIVPRSLVKHLVDDVRERSRRKQMTSLGLTRREEEILVLMVDGMTTREMAERFYVSAVTIRTHLSAIYKKLGVSDRAAALELIARLND